MDAVARGCHGDAALHVTGRVAAVSYVVAGYAVGLSVLRPRTRAWLVAPVVGARRAVALSTDAATRSGSAPPKPVVDQRAGDRAGRPAPPGAAAGAPTAARTGVALFVVFAVLARGASVFLLVEGLGSSLDYFDTVRPGAGPEGHPRHLHLPARGHGGAGHASAHARSVPISPCPAAASGWRSRTTGSPPQLFQPGIPVVVVGHFASAGSDVFVSDQIMVKHSANYIAAHPDRVQGAERHGAAEPRPGDRGAERRPRADRGLAGLRAPPWSAWRCWLSRLAGGRPARHRSTAGSTAGSLRRSCSSGRCSPSRRWSTRSSPTTSRSPSWPTTTPGRRRSSTRSPACGRRWPARSCCGG